MRRFRTLLGALVAVAICIQSTKAEEDNQPIKLFILAGQSNMVGAGRSDELPLAYRSSPQNVRVLSAAGKLLPLKPEGRIGPEVSFSHELARAWPDRTIVILKYAFGGTSALAWSPTWSAEQARLTDNERRGPLYQQLMTRLRPMLERDDVEIVAMLWAQGGRDARFPVAARNYHENLLKIIKAARRDTRRADLPFLMAQTVAAPTGRFPDIDRVRAAQQKIAQDQPHTYLISSDKLAKRADNIHFDTQGQIELGKRFANAFLTAGQQQAARDTKWLGTWQALASDDCKELSCRARRVNGVDWEATFTGVCNRRFSFQVTMRGRAAGGKISFTGETDLGPDNGGVYTWTGHIKGDKFTGQYKSTAGKQGTFTMQPVASKP